MTKHLNFCALMALVAMGVVFTACTAYSDNPVKPVGIAIDETNFPDECFRNYLFRWYDFAEDGILTAEEIKNTTTLEVNRDYIKSLKGIEYFTALKKLYCYGNEITELDLSKNTALTYLDCFCNRITKLTLSNNALLDSLDCSANELTELDVSNNPALVYLDCYDNKLSQLDVTKNTALVLLNFDSNQITSIDLSNNIWLEELYCSGNGITKLDVSACERLELLYCYQNKISGQNMDNLISSLPLNDTPTYFDLAVVDFTEEADKEGNVMTKSQVETTKAKGWKPLQWDDDEFYWVDYPGSE